MSCRYTVTSKGKRHSVPRAVFWSLALPLLSLFVLVLSWACWLTYLSAHMLADYLAIPAWACVLLMLMSLGSITIDGQARALMPATIRHGLGLCLVWVTIYYQYAAQHWSPSELFLLAGPAMALGLLKLWHKRATARGVARANPR